MDDSLLRNNRTAPKCEFDGAGKPIAFSYFRDNPKGSRWMFCGHGSDDYEYFWFSIDEFFESKETVSWWLNHLADKVWMDFDEFEGMIRRYESKGGDIHGMGPWIFDRIEKSRKYHKGIQKKTIHKGRYSLLDLITEDRQ